MLGGGNIDKKALLASSQGVLALASSGLSLAQQSHSTGSSPGLLVSLDKEWNSLRGRCCSVHRVPPVSGQTQVSAD